MGAGCYKERTFTIQKDAILKAIQEQYMSETILAESFDADNNVLASGAAANQLNPSSSD